MSAREDAHQHMCVFGGLRTLRPEREQLAGEERDHERTGRPDPEALGAGVGDHALDDTWKPYWQARVAEGDAFGSHTWRHGSFRADLFFRLNVVRVVVESLPGQQALDRVVAAQQFRRDILSPLVRADRMGAQRVPVTLLASSANVFNGAVIVAGLPPLAAMYNVRPFAT